MWGHHSAGLLSYVALYTIGMLKLYTKRTFQVLMTVFYSYLSLGNKRGVLIQGWDLKEHS